MVSTFISQKCRKLSIVTGSVADSTGDPHFEIEKYIYIVAMLIVARLQIVLLDDSLLSYRSLVHFRKNMKHKYPKYVFTALETQSNVTWVFWAMSFDDVRRGPTKIPPCSVGDMKLQI